MSCCAHCGRTDTIMGHLSCGMISVGLCHAEPDGDRADPDCYHLVSGQERPREGRQHAGCLPVQLAGCEWDSDSCSSSTWP